jgi:hypothetical protein
MGELPEKVIVGGGLYCACLMLYSCLYSLAHTRARAHRLLTDMLNRVLFACSLFLLTAISSLFFSSRIQARTEAVQSALRRLFLLPLRPNLCPQPHDAAGRVPNMRLRLVPVVRRARRGLEKPVGRGEITGEDIH